MEPMKPVDRVEASPAAPGVARDRRIWQVYFLVTVVLGLFLHYVFGVSTWLTGGFAALGWATFEIVRWLRARGRGAH